MREHEANVRIAGRLGVRAALALAIGIIVVSALTGAAALSTRQGCEHGRQAELPRAAAMAEVYAAQLAPAAARSRAELAVAVADANWHSASRLLGVLDRDGAAVAVRGDRGLLEKYLERVLVSGGTVGLPVTQFVEGNAALCVPDTVLAGVPLVIPGKGEAVGTVVYAVRALKSGSGGAARYWWSVAALLVASGLGAFLGACLLWHSVLEPLRATVRLARRADRPVAWTTRRTFDEIVAIGGLVGELQQNLDQHRAQLAHLEADIERRVQTETEKMSRQLRQVERKVWLDPLTKLGNRRMLEERFEDVLAGQRRAGQGLSLVMIDVDNFKALNDTMGHKAGDELLAFIGELLRQSVRDCDLAIRYGGDEFLLILPCTAMAEAAAVAERLVRLFGQRAQLYAFDPKPSLSAGVASLLEHGPVNTADFLQMADQALYRAKHMGKSCVFTYQPGRSRAR